MPYVYKMGGLPHTLVQELLNLPSHLPVRVRFDDNVVTYDTIDEARESIRSRFMVQLMDARHNGDYIDSATLDDKKARIGIWEGDEIRIWSAQIQPPHLKVSIAGQENAVISIQDEGRRPIITMHLENTPHEVNFRDFKDLPREYLETAFSLAAQVLKTVREWPEEECRSGPAKPGPITSHPID